MNNCCCRRPQWCFLVLYCPDERLWGLLYLGLILFKICDRNPGYLNVLTKSNFAFIPEHWYAFTYDRSGHKGQGCVGSQQVLPLSGQGPFYALSAPCLCPSVANQPYMLGGRRCRPWTPPIVKANHNVSVHELSLPSSVATPDLPSPPAWQSHRGKASPLTCLSSRGANEKAGHSLYKAVVPEISFCFTVTCKGWGTKITAP